VAASAGARPEEAAASAAAASMAGALYAGRHLLSLSSVEFEKITAAIDNGITLLSVEAARFSRQSVSELPAWIAPGLEFLAEEHARRERSVFAS
jgi:hypothetical protein